MKYGLCEVDVNLIKNNKPLITQRFKILKNNTNSQAQLYHADILSGGADTAHVYIVLCDYM